MKNFYQTSTRLTNLGLFCTLICLTSCADSETISKNVTSEVKPQIEQLTRSVDQAKQGLGSIRSSIDQELKALHAEVIQATSELASTRAQFSGIISEQHALLATNQKQLSTTETRLKEANVSMESLQKVMAAQDLRISEMVTFYKDRKFIILNTLGDEKLETTGLPQNSIGDVEAIDGLILNLKGIDGSIRNTPPIATSTVKALGPWKINGKDYQYADQISFTVAYHESATTGRVLAEITNATFVNSIGQLVTHRASGLLIGNDGKQGLSVPGFQKSVKLVHPIEKGQKFTLILTDPLPIAVK